MLRGVFNWAKAFEGVQTQTGLRFMHGQFRVQLLSSLRKHPLLLCAGSRSAKKTMASHIVQVPRKRRLLCVALFHCETATRGA